MDAKGFEAACHRDPLSSTSRTAESSTSFPMAGVIHQDAGAADNVFCKLSAGSRQVPGEGLKGASGSLPFEHVFRSTSEFIING